MSGKHVVVWERMDEAFIGWQTYSMTDCERIEAAYQIYETKQDKSDEKFSLQNYVAIDFSTLEEIEDKKAMRPIHRLTYPMSSAFGQGITWMWDCGGHGSQAWIPYAAELVNHIEEEYGKNKTSKFNLAAVFPNMNYTIDFQSSIQFNNMTKFPRSIRRTPVMGKYPSDSSTKRTASVASLEKSTSSGEGPSSNILKQKMLPESSKVAPELSNFAVAVGKPPDEDCCICMTGLCNDSIFTDSTKASHSGYATVVELIKCKHVFHSDCLKAAFKNSMKQPTITCPYCKTIYGTKTGNQPPGTMRHKIIHQRLPGYNCNTIQITYHISPGIQTAEHPNPGQPFYASFPRTAFLPNNTEGEKVLALLKIAWQRRLIFTVGQSVTTGVTNTVTWNEIHHKTSMHNYSGHGYPDPNYLTNVISELKDQGVTEDDLK